MKIRKVGLYCGASFFSRSSWKSYGIIRWVRHRNVKIGFSIGPLLFWDGS